MTDLELMQQARDALVYLWDGCPADKALVERLDDRLAQPEQDPVAWRNTETGEFSTGGFLRNKLGQWMPLYTSSDWAAIYTAPPQREWQGLTDEEKLEIMKMFGLGQRGAFADAIEAKLKEKNT